jgi:mRNA interferase MazF
MAYQPKQGDVIFLDFQPQTGHEQAGRRPAVIVSNAAFHKCTNGLAMVCPVTNTTTPFPLHVPLDSRSKTTGVVMCEQVKSLDIAARHAEFRETLPEDLLAAVLERIRLALR